MPGHFEVYPVMGDVGGHHSGGQDPETAERLMGPVGFRWRYVDDHERELAISGEDFNSAEEAKAAVGEFVLETRQTTYGLRFAGTIADAVRVVGV